MCQSQRNSLNNQVWEGFSEPELEDSNNGLLSKSHGGTNSYDSVTSEWILYGSVYINVHLIEKIINFKVVKCQEKAHYFASGGCAPAAQGCPDHHGDIVDRRRPLLSQKCYELKGVAGQQCTQQELYMKVISHEFAANTKRVGNRIDSPLFNYSNRMCTNYEHFKSVKNPQ